jgi:hypothetical protein
MAIRIIPDMGQPSAAIEIALEKPLPDYDLEQVEQPSPRDIDSLLVSQGFRDLVDDARGVLMELAASPPRAQGVGPEDLHFTERDHFEITQLTGAICPGGSDVYRPGLWIVLRDTKASEKSNLNEVALKHVRVIMNELVKRLGL